MGNFSCRGQFEFSTASAVKNDGDGSHVTTWQYRCQQTSFPLKGLNSPIKKQSLVLQVLPGTGGDGVKYV